MRTIKNNYRVVVDFIGNKVAKVTAVTSPEVKDAVDYINRTRAFFTKQYKGVGFVEMNKAIEYEFSRNHFATRNDSMMRYKLLRNTRSVHFLTYTYKEVRNEVYTALSGENEVFVHSPYKTQRTVEVQSAEQWAKLLTEEAAHNRDYAIEQERINNIRHLLSQRVQWLGYNTLQDILDACGNMETFIEYITSVIEEIERQGNWDTEMPTTRSFVDGQGVYVGKVKDGVKKGTREVISTTGDKTFDNYIVTDADVMTQFLSLTFYVAVGMKPMAKMIEVPDEDNPGFTRLVPMNPEDEFEPEYFKSNDLRTTPIYTTQEEELHCFYNKKLNKYSNLVKYNLPTIR